MPRFLGLEIQTDVRCASGARVAFFPATALIACGAVLSPVDPESLTVTVQRSDARAAEIVTGRVARTVFSDSALDREWDIVELQDADTDDQLTLVAHPIGLRMARKLYEAADGATGAPVLDYTAVGITAAEALDLFVLPALAARGMSWVVAGTIDATNRFDLAGQWASVLEIVRAIAEPGRANAEWQLRRNGNTDYRLDLVTQIGASAGTLRLRTAHNLLAHRRSRSTLEAATRVFPRGSDLGSERTMGAHLWRVAAKGTDGIGDYLTLEDIAGGDGPIAYDGQLDGLYVAPLEDPTWTPEEVDDSRASTQRVYVGDTSPFTVGQWVRFAVGATENGARLTSLTNPVMAAAPSAGGLGDLAEFHDVPEVRGDCNLVPNPWQRDWSNASNPADGYTVNAGTPANVTLARETTLVREGSPYAQRLTTTGTTTLSWETPDIPVWAIAGRRHIPALWFHVVDVPATTDSTLLFELRTAAGDFIGVIGRWVRNTEQLDTWFRIVGAAMDLSTVADAVRIRVTVTTASGAAAASGWDVVLAHAMLHEGEVEAEDIEYSGGTVLWQRANARLLEASMAIRGQDLRLLDLEADDPTTFSNLQIVPGQPTELTDQTLGEVSTSRILEFRADYLRPLAGSTVRMGRASTTLVRTLTEEGEPVEPPAPETPTLTVSETHNADEYVITWGGGPIVELSTDGGNTWTPPPPSPITVPRHLTFSPVYQFRARAGDRVVLDAVTVERKPTVAAADPSIDSITFANEDTPCDGGGQFDLDYTDSNMPGTELLDWMVQVLSGAGGPNTMASATGVSPGSFPVTINPLAMCPGAIVRATIVAKVAGVEIASRQTDLEMP